MEKKRNSSVRSGALIRFWVVIAAIIGIFLASVGWLAGHIRQGLDLQGGTHIVMQAADTDENKVPMRQSRRSSISCRSVSMKWV